MTIVMQSKITNGLSRYKTELIMSLAAAFGMFGIGVNSAWPGPVMGVLLDPNNEFYVDLSDTAWLSSLFSIGCLIGAIIGLYSTKLWSRKKTILTAAIPYIIAYIIFAFRQSLYWYYFGRILAGIASGMSWGAAPMYVTEIASVHIRGLLGAVLCAASGLGMVSVYVLVPTMNITTINYVFLVTAVAQFILSFYIPESPHFLLMSNQDEEAKRVLMKLRGSTDIQKEFLEISKYVHELNDVKLTEIFRDSLQRRSVLLACLTMLAQQLTGTAPIMTYSQRIFDTNNPFLSKELSGIIFSLFIFIAMLMSVALIEKLGRKKLLVFSSAACALPLSVLGVFFYLEQRGYENIASWSFIPLTVILIQEVIFGLGVGALPYTYMTELVSTNIRPYCSCFLTLTGAFSQFFTVQIFNKLDRDFGKWAPMVLFTGLTLMASVVMAMCLIETAGYTFSEIEAKLKHKKLDNNNESNS